MYKIQVSKLYSIVPDVLTLTIVTLSQISEFSTTN